MKRNLIQLICAIFVLTLSIPASASIVELQNVPDYSWTDGCSPTSATMLMAYYAINGYDGLSYSSLMPGSAPLNTFSQSNSVVTNAINAMASDMGTNSSGGTNLYYFSNGSSWTPADSIYYKTTSGDQTYGIYKYVLNAGYTSSVNTYIADTTPSDTVGFTFANLEYDINEGEPVLIDVSGIVDGMLEGHTMLAYGYNSSDDAVYIRDTWASGGYPGLGYNGVNGTMNWDGSYDGMSIIAVTTVNIYGGSEAVIDPPAATPEPATMILFGAGLLGIASIRRRMS